MNIFLTGHSSGFGKALALYCLNNNLRVFGLSRSELNNQKIIQEKCAFEKLELIPNALRKLKISKTLDLVILNAAELGTFIEFEQQKVADIKRVLDVNTWSNKIIIDFLIESKIKIDQLIFITSGASQRNESGWESYSISKLVVNKFAVLYANLLKETHVCALSPGIIDTKMQHKLRDLDSVRFPSLNKLKKAHKENRIPTAEVTAKLLFSKLDNLRQYESGSLVSLKDL